MSLPPPFSITRVEVPQLPWQQSEISLLRTSKAGPSVSVTSERPCLKGQGMQSLPISSSKVADYIHERKGGKKNIFEKKGDCKKDHFLFQRSLFLCILLQWRFDFLLCTALLLYVGLPLYIQRRKTGYALYFCMLRDIPF